VVSELPDLLSHHVGASRYVLIGDDRVSALHGAQLFDAIASHGREALSLTFPAGEENKNRTEWARLTDSILAAGIGRDGCIVALGGGVTGDLAGFVAATYMRGIPVVQLPTSLVAMVDSAVGGKTGVDVPSGKNLVGAFHPPAFVLVDPVLTGTLPRRERSQGLAEAIKHGAIVDRDYLSRIESDMGALLRGDPAKTAEIVSRSIEIKAEVVSEDERESGRRQILNFGHTLGHAVEAAFDFRLPHGDSVAIGMVLESRLGEDLGVTREGTAEALSRVLDAAELPTRLPSLPDPELLLDLVARDKKVRKGLPRYVFLRQIGETERGEGWSRGVDSARVRDFLLREFSRQL
jgi:3-dehydroquinate synthase